MNNKSVKYALLLMGIVLSALFSFYLFNNRRSSKDLVIGGITSRSGGAAFYGEECLKGGRIALDVINKENKIKVMFIAQDDKSDKTEAVKLAENLINYNKVDVLWGPIISPSAVSVGKLCDEYKVPMVTPSATQDEVTVSDKYQRKYVSRMCFMDKDQGRVLADFLYNKLKKKTAIIVFDKAISYSVGLANSFKLKFVSLGGKIVAEESYSVGDADFSPLISKVANYDADAIFIPGWDENVGPMLRQSGDKWNNYILLGGDGWPSKKLLDLSGGNIHNAYALAHYSNEDLRPVSVEFNTLYRSKYKEDPSPHAALGYDAMMLIYEAAKNAEDYKSRVLLNKSIHEIRNLSLVTGDISVQSSGDVLKKGYIVKIGSSGMTLIESVSLK